MLKGFQNEAKMDAGAAVGSQLLDFGSQNLQNITKTASKISEISRLRRGYIFGAVLGAKKVLTCKFPRIILGAIFDQNSKTNRKNVVQKGMQN